ncbi:unnamed protein product, partial [Sphacelaria rigidula]
GAYAADIVVERERARVRDAGPETGRRVRCENVPNNWRHGCTACLSTVPPAGVSAVSAGGERCRGGANEGQKRAEKRRGPRTAARQAAADRARAGLPPVTRRRS